MDPETDWRRHEPDSRWSRTCSRGTVHGVCCGELRDPDTRDRRCLLSEAIHQATLLYALRSATPSLQSFINFTARSTGPYPAAATPGVSAVFDMNRGRAVFAMARTRTPRSWRQRHPRHPGHAIRSTKAFSTVDCDRAVRLHMSRRIRGRHRGVLDFGRSGLDYVAPRAGRNGWG